MKIRFIIICVLLLAASLIGKKVYENSAKTHEEQRARASFENLVHGSEDTESHSHSKKRGRIDPRIEKRLEAQRISRDLLNFAKSLENNDGKPDAVVAEEVFRAFEQQLRSLDAMQLGVILDELVSNLEVGENIRIGIGFRLGENILSQYQPDIIMDLLDDKEAHKGFAGLYIKYALHDSLNRLMADDVDRALNWFHTHSERYSQLVDIDGPKNSLVATAGKKDLSLVPKLISDLGLKDPSWAMSGIAETLKNQDDRTKFLQLMRRIEGDALHFDSAWHRLGDGLFAGDFETATQWITENQLSENELMLLLESLTFEKKNETEASRWNEWLDEQYPNREK